MEVSVTEHMGVECVEYGDPVYRMSRRRTATLPIGPGSVFLLVWPRPRGADGRRGENEP